MYWRNGCLKRKDEYPITTMAGDLKIAISYLTELEKQFVLLKQEMT